MKKYLGFAAVSVFLLFCADYNTDRDNPYDELADNSIRNSSAEGSSSSVEAGEPSSSSVNEELSSSSSDEELISSSAEPSSSSAEPSSSSEAESSSSVVPSSSSSNEELSSSSSDEELISSSAEPSSSSAEPSSSSEAESSSSVVPSSSSGVQEPVTTGNLSFINADYTDGNGNKYYWLGTEPETRQNLDIANKIPANCDGDIIYEPSWDNTNSPGPIKICAKAFCDNILKTLKCAEAEFFQNPSLSGTCKWTEAVESPVVASKDIVPIGISIQNNYGRCDEDIYLSLDGANIWTPSWQAETANLPITGIKAYANCSGSLTGGITCPDITKKIKNPNATGYIVDDRDGQAYQIVKMGDQTWMAENLNYNPAGNSACYDNKTSNCTTYGRLYDWGKANTACPTGWHFPSTNEWSVLTSYVGSNAGTKLKATSGWNDNGNGLDLYGFSALPGGRDSGGGSFSDVGNIVFFWRSARDNYMAYFLTMSYNSNNTGGNYVSKSELYSVRCVQDQD